jgi:hypothetical protein
MTNQPLENITLPITIVNALFQFAGRATLTRQEWRNLEQWEKAINESQKKRETEEPTPLPVGSGA